MYRKSTYYNYNIQVYAMQHLYPQFKVHKRGLDVIEFTGNLIVKPTFPVYTVSITYNGDISPMVKVLNPALVVEPKHFYQGSGTLCLYHSKNYHWTKEKLIAKDIVPWTAAWIYFYETWLETGNWYGPEVEHD